MRAGPTPIAHMQLAAAMTAAQQSDEQALSCTNRRHGLICLPVDRVALPHALVFLVSGPINIPHMMVGEKDTTLFRRAIRSLAFLEPARYQRGLHWASSPHVSPSIKRIAQNVGNEALGGNLPDQACATNGVRRQFHCVIPKPLKGLAH